jgi:hypothetical protein
MSTEARISPSGRRTIATGPASWATPIIAAANAITNPNSMMQKASSSATTPNNVETIEPFARSSEAIATVAAGAVADAIAPRSSAMGSGARKAQSATATTAKVVRSWIVVMTRMARPLCRSLAIRNSDPMVIAIRPSAMWGTGASASTTWSGTRFETEGPRMRPATT